MQVAVTKGLKSLVRSGELVANEKSQPHLAFRARMATLIEAEVTSQGGLSVRQRRHVMPQMDFAHTRRHLEAYAKASGAVGRPGGRAANA